LLPNPQGNIYVKLWDRDRWKNDDFLGEVAISLDLFRDQEEVEEWYTLEGEPKKKHKDSPPGEIRVKLFCPNNTRNQSFQIQTVSPNNNNTTNDIPHIFKECYDIFEELGRGGFSVVNRCVNKVSGEAFAVKIIAKNQSVDEISLLNREIEIMTNLKHDHIIQLFDVFDEYDNIYLILELVTGGELFDQIIDKGSYSEQDAANIIKQLLEAVSFMHSHGIAHRDLKPENILVTGKNNEIIKVSDFGLSKNFGKEKLKTACGTPDYVAPEVLRGGAYDNTVDVWSIGVICYILLCGFPPFFGSNDQQIFEKIMKVDYDFPSPDWDEISDDAKEFIGAILVFDFKQRPTAEQCLEAPWITGNAPTTQISNSNRFKDGLTQYSEKRKNTRSNISEIPNFNDK